MTEKTKTQNGGQQTSHEEQLSQELKAAQDRLALFEKSMVRVSYGNYRGSDVIKVQVAGRKPMLLGRLRSWGLCQVIDEIREFVGDFRPSP